jgi:hypothetical protein
MRPRTLPTPAPRRRPVDPRLVDVVRAHGPHMWRHRGSSLAIADIGAALDEMDTLAPDD